MKTAFSHTIHITIVLLFSTMLNLQKVHAQTTDSLIRSSSFNSALQFQLIGGIGVYYIGDWSSVSGFRIGADVSLNHANQSGSNNGYDISIYTPPSPSSVQENTSQPEQTSNSYQISLSGLYLQQLAEYKQTLVYCGIGPEMTYHWDRSTSKYPETYTSSDTSSSTNSQENTNKISGIGPLAILGVRSRLLDRVSLSAEIELSAIYQWTVQTNSYISTTTSPPYAVVTYKSGSISDLNGWSISLNAIRVGLIIEL